VVAPVVTTLALLTLTVLRANLRDLVTRQHVVVPRLDVEPGIDALPQTDVDKLIDAAVNVRDEAQAMHGTIWHSTVGYPPRGEAQGRHVECPCVVAQPVDQLVVGPVVGDLNHVHR